MMDDNLAGGKPVNSSVGRLAQYNQFTDKQVYETLCEIYPNLLECFDKLAQTEAFMGYSDDELLSAFRKVWPQKTRHLWEEDNEFRGRLMLRGIHYAADCLRARRTSAHAN